MEKAKAAGVKQLEEDEDTQIHYYIIAALNEELSEPWLYTFTCRVDAQYFEHIIKHYSGFTPITNEAIPPQGTLDVF